MQARLAAHVFSSCYLHACAIEVRASCYWLQATCSKLTSVKTQRTGRQSHAGGKINAQL